jgi:gluconolactonase
MAADGTLKTLVGRFDGKIFNAPNDLAVHPKGWVYFSDPRYVGPEPLELDHQSVYLYSPDGSLKRATTDITKPNGVIVSPDGKTLYVAETDNGTTGVEPEGTKPAPVHFTLNAFPIKADGSLGPKRVLHNFGDVMGIDGMTVDTAGHIYTAVRNPARHGIAVFTPAGKEIAFLSMEPLPTNCTFGRGAEAGVLYITADSGLYRIATTQTGFHP